jgi:hypothetical protein
MVSAEISKTASILRPVFPFLTHRRMLKYRFSGDNDHPYMSSVGINRNPKSSDEEKLVKVTLFI